MKIKTKKQLKLPQLIEWAWDNPDLSHGMTFISNGCERVQIDFKYNPRGVLNLDILNGTNISNDIQFTLEEYDEITEDTVMPTKLIEIDVNGVRFEWNNKSINEIKNYQTKTIHAVIYGEFKLVWEKYKGMVE